MPSYAYYQGEILPFLKSLDVPFNFPKSLDKSKRLEANLNQTGDSLVCRYPLDILIVATRYPQLSTRVANVRSC